MALAVNDSNFEEVVLKSAQPVLVDFWAEWCGPCKMMLPIVEEIATEFEGKVVVAKVDVDSSQATAAKFGIRNIPTILFRCRAQSFFGRENQQTSLIIRAHCPPS